MGTKRSVAVNILGHEYRVRTEADPAAVRRVATLVDETMDRIRQRTGTVDTLDLAILAALNLANDLLAKRSAGGTAPAPAAAAEPRKLRALIESVETAIREAGSATA